MDSMLRYLNLDLATDRHLIFATDVIHFLSTEFQAGWHPAGLRYYHPHALSPFSHQIAEAVKYILRERDRDFRTTFEELIPEDTTDLVAVFTEHARCKFYQVFYNGGSAAELFETIVYVARLGILFHQQRGVEHVLDLAVISIGEAILHFMQTNGPGLFCSFTMIASSLVLGD